MNFWLKATLLIILALAVIGWGIHHPVEVSEALHWLNTILKGRKL